MQIESLHIKNYKVFKDTKIAHLSRLCVFLGVNGSGKTTLFDVIGFLYDALEKNITTAIARRGGAKEVWTRNTSPDKEPIAFEIKFRNPKAFGGRSPLITYSIEILFSDGKAVVQKEILKYRRGNRGKPWHFLDFAQGGGKTVTNEKDYGETDAKEQREDYKLDSADILAIKGLGQFEGFRVINDFRKMIERWHVSNFSIDAARSVSETGMDEHLNISGSNLAQVTKHMHEHHRSDFDEILKKLPQRIPGISEVEAVDTIEGRIVLKFKDKNFQESFIGKFVSDGTLKMFAYMILLYDPDPHPLLCIEEPENFLHIDLLDDLAEEIREYAEKGGQVFVSTHSPDFVNALRIDELFFLIKDKGKTTIKAASNDPETVDLYNNGNRLGWLWRNNYIKGAKLDK